MASQSYSVARASQELGVSIPTVKAMYRRGELAGFRTPGQHLRISSESVNAIRNDGRARTSSVPAPSSALRMRQERIQELHLEGEELRSRRELKRLQAEQDEESEHHAEEERARETEREERREQARAERLRQERLQEEAAAQQRRAALRQQVQLALHATLPASLSYEQRKSIAEEMETELCRAGVETPEAAIPIIRSVTERFMESLRSEASARRREESAARSRASALDLALWKLQLETHGAVTEAERAEAATAIRAAWDTLAPDKSETEFRLAAERAIAPIRGRVAQRQHHKEIIESGVREVFPYLVRLQRAGGISSETLFDFSLRAELEGAVRRRLSAELPSEDPGAMRRLVHNLVDAEIEQ